PPIGSTIATEIRPETGFPAAVVTTTDHGQRAPTFGVCVGARNTTFGGAAAAAGTSRSAGTHSPQMRPFTPRMLCTQALPEPEGVLDRVARPVVVEVGVDVALAAPL